jgi:hypothetical protein
MYAQLIEGGTTPDRRAEMDRLVSDEMVPTLKAEPGFAGALNLVDRDSKAMMIVLWRPTPRRAARWPTTAARPLRRSPASPRFPPACAGRSPSGR